MSNKETSTLQSAIDTVSSTAQNVIHSLTGNPGDKAAADRKEAEAQAHSDLSHATVKAGPITATADGVAKDNPKRTEGSWDQTIGSGQQFVGNLVGNQGLKDAGAERNLLGEQKVKKGQAEDLLKGVPDRAVGAVAGAVAGLTGDKEAQREAEAQHDRGKALQRGVEADLEKEVKK